MAQTDESAQTSTESKAPKFDGEFDPERAARLIENLRQEVASLKAEKHEISTSLQEREDAEKSESQRLADRLAKAEEDLKTARRDLFVERATRKHELPEDVVEFLTGDTEEEILAKAERLARLGKPKSDDPEPTTDEGPALPERPEPALAPTPGHGGESSEPFDPQKIALEALQGR